MKKIQKTLLAMIILIFIATPALAQSVGTEGAVSDTAITSPVKEELILQDIIAEEPAETATEPATEPEKVDSLKASVFEDVDVVPAENLKAAGLIDERDRPDTVIDTEFRDAIRGFLNYFLGFLGLIAVIAIIYGGVLLVTSGGNEESLGKAKKILGYAVGGIILILLSYTIVRMVVTIPVT